MTRFMLHVAMAMACTAACAAEPSVAVYATREPVDKSYRKMIKDMDTSAQQGVQLVSAKTNEADQHAIDAGNKAQTAQLTATQTTAHLSEAEQMVGNVDQYKAGAQTEIRDPQSVRELLARWRRWTGIRSSSARHSGPPGNPSTCAGSASYIP